MDTGTCPYCGHDLHQSPKRKGICPACGGSMRVRTKQTLLPSALLTESDARVVDWVQRSGIDHDTFHKTRQKLSQRFGHTASAADTLWALLSAERDYYSMALFLNEEGRPSWDLLAEAARVELLRFQRLDEVELVKIRDIRDSYVCESCQALSGRILTLAEALETMPIPNRACTFRFRDSRPPFCRCSYRPIFPSDQPSDEH